MNWEGLKAEKKCVRASCTAKLGKGIKMKIGFMVGLTTGIIILLLVFILSVIAWELFKRDFK